MKELLKYIKRRLESCRNEQDLHDLRRDYDLFMKFLDEMPIYAESDLIKAFITEEQEGKQDGDGV